MFISENILLNTTISVLQKVDNKKDSQWEVRDVIFTDRALYIFGNSQNTREQILNYLTASSERLEMDFFKAKNPMDGGDD